MTIYYSVRPVIYDDQVLGKGKIEALALLAAETFIFKDAPIAAKAAAERHNMAFDVIKVVETQEGRYKPASYNLVQLS